jgi:hypothetical protein
MSMARSAELIAMTLTVAEPELEHVPLVAVTEIEIAPDAGAVKVIDGVPLPDVMVPFAIDHE